MPEQKQCPAKPEKVYFFATCLMNVGGHLDYRQTSIESRHIASFIWERTHAKER